MSRKIKVTKNGIENILEVDVSAYDDAIKALALDAAIYNRDNVSQMIISDVSDAVYIIYDSASQKIITAEYHDIIGYTHIVDTAIWNELSIYGVQNLYFNSDNVLTVDLSVAKTFKKQEMADKFDEEIASGSFESTTLGIEVDCRRSSTKNDYQNVEALLAVMKRDNISSVTYVGASNQTAPATQEQIQNLIYEMEYRTIELYNSKWAFKDAISKAQTLDDLKKIEITYKKKSK